MLDEIEGAIQGRYLSTLRDAGERGCGYLFMPRVMVIDLSITGTMTEVDGVLLLPHRTSKAGHLWGRFLNPADAHLSPFLFPCFPSDFLEATAVYLSLGYVRSSYQFVSDCDDFRHSEAMAELSRSYTIFIL